MRRSYLINAIAVAVIVLVSAVLASAQVEAMRGSVKVVGADGKPAPVAGAIIDVWRTDMKAEYHTKTDKKGDWVFAGLPFVGVYTISVSAPGASPWARGGVKARNDQPVEIVMSSGDGKKLTEAEALAAGKGGSAPAEGSGGGGGAAEKAKADEIAKKNAEIMESNKKVDNANKIIGDAFKAGNAALVAKNYDEAIKQYDTGIAADPDHPGIPSLLSNKSEALRTRAVERYNAAVRANDDAGKQAAKADFTAAADAANKAIELIDKAPAPADATEKTQRVTNRYFALSARARAMSFVATLVDPTKGPVAATAYEELIAAETDPLKKAKLEKEYAQVLFDAAGTIGDQASYEKAVAQYQKILEKNPDDSDALLRIGQSLFTLGSLNNNDKAKYQEASNYLQRFVDKAPDTQAQMKAEAKDLIATMKQQANITPEKTPARPKTGTGKRP